MSNSSLAVVGTRRMTSFRPSVEPMPIEASERTDVTSE